MNKKTLQSLLLSLSISTMLVGVCSLPSHGQNSASSPETIKKVVTLKQANGESLNFEVSGQPQRVNNAAATAAIMLAAGVNASGVKTAIALVMAGADPESVGNLILGLNGLIRENSDVNITQLNQAITAYNDIVDKADSNVLQEISKNSEFLNIGDALKKMREPII
ncbi:hypothetical protein [Richelia sinica]|nr:hypothetical protein [Richelia sinica]MBD2665187.1 hypothetical protein [Richelia sinica FACHB-800]